MKKYLPMIIFLVIAISAGSILYYASRMPSPQQKAQSAGNTYYVATNGSNSNPCSLSAPCLTISYGSSILKPGETLYVRGGVYNENVEIPADVRSNSWNNPITIAVAPGETATIYGNFGVTDHLIGGGFGQWSRYLIIDGFIVDAHDASHVALYTDVVGDVRFQNMEVKNAQHSGFQGCGSGSTGICEFINMNVHHNGLGPNTACNNPAVNGGQCHGIYIHPDNNILIDGGEYHHNEAWGITSTNSTASNDKRFIIRNVKVHDNGGGIFPVGGQTNGRYVIYNNVVYNNDIWLAGAPVDFYNNTVNANIRVDGSISELKNNIANDITEVNGGNILSNNLTTNPNFINPAAGDFHLQPGSPAIDTGMNLAQVTTDADGKTRPAGGATDIGAYEYGATGGSPKPSGAPVPSSSTPAKATPYPTPTIFYLTPIFTCLGACPTLPVSPTLAGGVSTGGGGAGNRVILPTTENPPFPVTSEEPSPAPPDQGVSPIPPAQGDQNIFKTILGLILKLIEAILRILTGQG